MIDRYDNDRTTSTVDDAAADSRPTTLADGGDGPATPNGLVAGILDELNGAMRVLRCAATGRL